MKIKKDETSPIEYVKLEKCPDCGEVTIKQGEEEITGSVFLAEGWKIIEIGREEMAAFNEFLSEPAERIRVGWDFTCYMMDRLDEEEELNGEENV